MSPTPPVFTPPGPEKLPALAIAGIVMGIVLLGAALAAAAVLSVFTARSVVDSAFAVDDVHVPIVVGEPGRTTAVNPLECLGTCFGDDAFAELVVNDTDLQRLGMTVADYGLGDYISSDTSAEYHDVLRFWKEERVSPDSCFFSYFTTPVATPYTDKQDGNKDQIEYIQGLQTSDEYSALNITARTFASSVAATQHMMSLSDQVEACDKYELPQTRDAYAYETLLTPAAGLNLPDSVAAVGWVESSENGRFYAFDLQRGNLVVRHTVSTDGLTLETDFRSFVEAQARQLAALPLSE